MISNFFHQSFVAQRFHQINTPPLLPIAICFILGIAWHSFFTMLCIIFICTLCCAFFAYIQHTQFPFLIIFCSLFAMGGALLHHKEWHDYNSFYAYVSNKKVAITGTVIDIYETTVNHQKTTVLALAIDTIATKENTYKSNKTMLFYGKCNKTMVVGDTVTVLDIICKKPSSEDFQRYQIKEQTLATLFNKSFDCRIDHHPTWSLRLWIWQQKQRILNAMHDKLSPEGFRFFSSLFLGNRAYVKESLEEVSEQFKTWGIYHFLARSGLHLAIFLMLWQMLFYIIPLPFIVKHILLSLIGITYCMFSWTTTPFARSFALFLLNKLCFFSKTPFNTMHYLTLICVGFLLYCPLYLFFLDFQLTFALTFALVWLNQVTIAHRTQQSNY
jgi:predicted membrane metal-binding protein